MIQDPATPLSERIPLDDLITCARVLGINPIFDPFEYPDGPTERERYEIIGLVGAAADVLQAQVTASGTDMQVNLMCSSYIHALSGVAVSPAMAHVGIHAMTVTYTLKRLVMVINALRFPGSRDVVAMLCVALSICGALVGGDGQYKEINIVPPRFGNRGFG